MTLAQLVQLEADLEAIEAHVANVRRFVENCSAAAADGQAWVFRDNLRWLGPECGKTMLAVGELASQAKNIDDALPLGGVPE